jgi:hypothetical protein
MREFLNCELREIEVHEHFPKQTIRNRCEILSGNGILLLSVPIIHAHGLKQITKEIRVDYSTSWQLDHWKAIESAYTSAPYYEEYQTQVKSLILTKHEFLLEKNEAILSFILNVLNLEISHSNTVSFNNEIPTSKNLFLEKDNWEHQKNYQQVFSYSKPFTPNLSVLDLIFNEGPFCRNWLLSTEN